MERGKVGREILVRDILDPIKRFPAHLSLTDQGLFAIGYYHQMKDLWTSKQDREQEKEEINHESV
jgi:CRISPR-associated protein Csd1